MKVPLDRVRELRTATLAGIVDCKKALEETGGDVEKAKVLLRKKGIKIAEKKSLEATREGLIASYIHHNGRIGVLVEIGCQSDFVARNSEFQDLARDVAMHIAAACPRWISPEEVSDEACKQEKEILIEEAKREGKPDAIVEKMVEGRIRKFYGQHCLLEQPYVKDESKRVRDYIQEVIARLGENITVERFVRFELGEGRD